jgi:hypothetical protein
LLAGIAAVAAIAPTLVADTVIHVAPHGDDAADGSAGRPLKSLPRGQQLAREARSRSTHEQIRVEIAAGEYVLSEPLVFAPEDSGASGNLPLTFAARGDVRLSGGRRIDGFHERDGHWVAAASHDLPAFRDLWVNGRRAIRARSPNEGFYRIASAGPDRRTSFIVEPSELLQLAHPDTAEVVYLHDWSISRVGMAAIDPASRTYRLAAPIGAHYEFFSICGFEPHPRYFVENAHELLDAPGEWFLDVGQHELHYLPREGESIETVDVIAPHLQQLLLLSGTNEKPVESIHFDGLNLSYAAFDLPPFGFAEIQANNHSRRRQADDQESAQMTAAVAVDRAKNCSFTDCRFEHLAGAGLHITHSENVRVENSRFSDIGGNGIMVGSLSSDEKPPAIGNVIENCTVERCGQTFYGAVGIWNGMATNTVIRNNEVRDLPYTGISIGWSWGPNPTICRGHQIRNNHIHHVVQLLSDGGGIYTLGFQPGTVLAGNVIHDVPVNAGRAESNGMFIDEGSTDLKIEGNTIYAVARSPIRFNMAGKNTVARNRLTLVPGTPPFQYNGTNPADMTYIENEEIADAKWQPPADDAAVKQAGPQSEPGAGQ